MWAARTVWKGMVSVQVSALALWDSVASGGFESTRMGGMGETTPRPGEGVAVEGVGSCMIFLRWQGPSHRHCQRSHCACSDGACIHDLVA